VIRTIYLEDEQATLRVAGNFQQKLLPGLLICLTGTLGAGKTCFVRGCLRAGGYTGAVKSPTFTIVEEYRLDEINIFHMDLYRLSEPLELEYLGIRDYLAPDAICFIEWPERGTGVLPLPDIVVRFTMEASGRRLELEGISQRGQLIIASMDLNN
jgi:tRNA threonylcarbamoyladenosine biosynthesis protein TsaE